MQETADRAHNLETELEATRARLKYLAREHEELKASQVLGIE